VVKEYMFPGMEAHRMLRQEDHKFKASLDYVARPYRIRNEKKMYVMISFFKNVFEICFVI
jgi:hypothetical protein